MIQLKGSSSNLFKKSSARKDLVIPHGLSTPYVIEVLMFDGELIGELHLEYLYDYVDLFILVESSKSFSGHPKKVSLYHTEYLKKYEKKILKVLVNDFPEPSMNAVTKHDIFFEREAFQRNYALDLITAIVKDRPALIFSLDIDEFPSRELIQQMKHDYMENKLLSDRYKLRLNYSKYNFGFDLGVWILPSVITDKALPSRPNFDKLRLKVTGIEMMTGGWHASYFMSAERILKKINAFSHAEDNFITENPGVKRLSWINRCIDEGLELFNQSRTSSPRYYNRNYGNPTLWKIPRCDNCAEIMKKHNFLPH